MSRPRSHLLAATSLDRLGHLRKDAAWLDAARRDGRYVAVWRRKVLVSAGERPAPLLLAADMLAALDASRDSVLLGERDGRPCFAVALATEAPSSAGRFEDVRGLGDRLAPDDAALLAYARAMILWHERHGHCGVCGAPTESIEAGHARECRACGAKHFPRVDPAIIVLVADAQRCLLGRQAAWPAGRYSTIAGFVEPGESLEDAVCREVLEETGVRVEEVAYHGSQPWPFPSSLMLGFHARPAGGEIALRDGELEDARWFDRDDIAAQRVLLPPRVSIAYRLIEEWFDRAPGRRLAEETEPGPWIARPEA
ncbi:MAG TPA: NAD(+) diphosphatase [Gammaproteobacteria bacterium]|nr:NAD(+) diphosphatase [Gammaproteobacteria bacterium]